MCKWVLFPFVLVLTLICLQGASSAESDPAAMWSRLSQGGVAVLLRHALAPGYSDPSGFKLDDCTTQRNLSDTGRQQARDIGAAFRQHRITIDHVYTSQWCRCRETADLLGLGPVTPQPFLNSFFEQREREKQQTEALSRFLQTTQITNVMVLVTHQVNISALTGVYPLSGEAVIVDMENGGKLRVLGTIPFEH
ncbi:MAG: hypothetical protein ETSY1_34635 [Candidatus Entotheonella factor]|uniref:Phosphoglycerate mutase n=1 Tax=Entotheonella factor TaxID=1429438 RepID=W4L8Y7_ENTF1|nr:histidine phosphatase family protein [Candidatus Entotheonella palauensis]ETW94497.1 MAG: hypothetical protein ETSY1_34635 [Candidatus Entotheonella factor]